MDDVDFMIDAPAAGGKGGVVVMPQIAAAAQLKHERRRVTVGVAEDLKRRVALFAAFSVETALELLAAAGIAVVHVPFAARTAPTHRYGVRQIVPEMLGRTRYRVPLALGPAAVGFGRIILVPAAADLGPDRLSGRKAKQRDDDADTGDHFCGYGFDDTGVSHNYLTTSWFWLGTAKPGVANVHGGLPQPLSKARTLRYHRNVVE